MHISTAFYVAALSTVTSALPQSNGVAPEKINAFTLSVYNTGTILHKQSVEAGGQSFNLGLDGPSAYCPTPAVPVEACPPGNQTVVYGGGMQISVVVPGGQQTYVAPDGLVKFTQAHSAATTPGSFFGGFTNFTITDQKNVERTIINWKTPGNESFSGILACPDVPEWSTATYQIYAKTPEFNKTNCVELTGLLQTAQPNNNAGAWQYT